MPIIGILAISFLAIQLKVVYLPLVNTTDKDWLEKTRSKMQEILDENLHEDSNELPDASENLNETKTDKISEK